MTASANAENDLLHEKLRKQEHDFRALPFLQAEKEELLKMVACLQSELKVKQYSAKIDQQRMQDLESKASKEMDAIMHPINGMGKQSSDTPMYSFDDSEYSKGTGEDDAKDTEIVNLKDIIETLKRELKNTPFATPAVTSASLDGVTDPEQFMIELTRVKESTADEILTLQDEVERLNQEISDQWSNQPYKPQPRHDGDSHQGRKLIDSIISKDEEIRELRREIAILRDQVDSTTISMTIPDDDDRSVISKLFNRGPYHTPAGVDSKDGIKLKSINESLRLELTEVKIQRDEFEVTLKEEREKADMELASFSDTLQGVDELRQAAEKMSREITRLKNQKDDEVPEDPFEDINNDAVEEYANKVQKFDAAKGIIGCASIQSGSVHPEKIGLWGKLRRSKISYRSTHRGRETDDDNASIFSSFF